MDAGGVRDIVATVGSTALTLAGAWSLLRRDGRAKSKADRRENLALAGQIRALQRVIGLLRDAIARCPGCVEPETERIDAVVNWEYEADEE